MRNGLLFGVTLGFCCISAAAIGQPEEGGGAPAAAAPATRIGAALHGARWEFPCRDPRREYGNGACPSGLVKEKADPKTTDQFTFDRVFDGEPGKRYRVTVRFRGVVESMRYKNGKQDGDYFYIGGEPDNPKYNIYQLSISSPESHYFLNRQDKLVEPFIIDYTKTIEIDGGAKVTFHGNGQNGVLKTNLKKLVVPDVPPAPEAGNGQFVQMDVVSVEPAP